MWACAPLRVDQFPLEPSAVLGFELVMALLQFLAQVRRLMLE
jgi:hypothetical protein